MVRFRFTYQKTGALRYISHLDLQKIWVRVLFRAKLPISYTQGFHPAPKMATAWPLPLGWNGLGELIDFWLDLPEDSPYLSNTTALKNLVNSHAPSGLQTSAIELLPIYDPAITTVIDTADYRIDFPIQAQAEEKQSQIDALLARSTIERVRRNKPYDLRSLIESIVIQEDRSLFVRMAARDSAMGRPDELINELGWEQEGNRYTRIRFHLI